MPRPWSILPFALALLATFDGGVEACAPGFEPFNNGRCFQVLVGEYNYYGEWSKKCTDQGTVPGAIRNQVENDEFANVVQAYIKKYGLNDPGDVIWIGLTCDPSKGKFVWADGTVAKYTNFDVTYECNEANKDNFITYRRSTRKWHTYVHDIASIVCEHPHLTNEPCDELNLVSSGNTKDACVGILYNAQNWTEAEKSCSRANGHLASIHDENANSFIRRSAVAQQHTAGIHIGAYALANGSMAWKDGTAMDYNNFYPGFPDVDDDGGCTAMQVGKPFNGKWISIECGDTVKTPYVCGRAPYDNTYSVPPGCPTAPQYHDGDRIYSPGFPLNGTALQCDYVLSVPKGKAIELLVVEFQTNLCCDSLTLYDGLITTDPMAQITGIIATGTTYTSKTNNMRLSWNATNGVNVRGFHLLMHAV